MSEAHFSSTYAEARRRFADAALTAGADVASYRVDAESQDELAIDVAVVGADSAPAVVVSSGVHGVEGFFGSAVQLALLERLSQAQSQPSLRYVLIHGVNPFGFSNLRRCNEDNVDVNRNFLESADDYMGAPDGYAGLDSFLNPESPPARFEPFRLKALWNIWQRGLPALKETVAGGQYEYPRGLFFGGHGPSQSTQLVRKHCDSWLGSSQRIVHIDFHSGLGRFGHYKLLLTNAADPEDYSWYLETFGVERVEPLAEPDGTAYAVSGSFGDWMRSHFKSRTYYFVGAEFGTYGVIRVLAAIRAENRAHHYGSQRSSAYRSAKEELVECFCPAAASWRQQVVDAGLAIVAQGGRALVTDRA